MANQRAIQHVETTGGVLIEVPPRPEYLSLVRMMVRSLAMRRDLDDERVEDVTLAVSEAAGNAIDAIVAEHGAEGAHHRVEVAWRELPDRLVLEVVDRGGEIDVESLPDESVLADPGRAAIEGDLSVPLIRALVDELDIRSGGGGTALTLTVVCDPFDGSDPDGDR